MYKGRCNPYPGVTYHTIENIYTIRQNYKNLPPQGRCGDEIIDVLH